MSYKLYLDDLRTPRNDGWIVVRSYDEAVSYVTQHGWPTEISLDHDLGDNVPSGYDFARWLVDRDLQHSDMPWNFVWNVHSANPVGTANIYGLFTGYMKHKSNQ